MQDGVFELVVISGKGGAGKTSVVASFAALAAGAVLADCDVDAPDLHLILDPTIEKRFAFSGGVRAHVDPALCVACGKCQSICRFDVVDMAGPGNGFAPFTAHIDPIACEGCGVCARFCQSNAIVVEPAINGEYYVSSTRYGPMVHAKLGPAEENSGKLVGAVRQEARALAKRQGLWLSIIDGSPGIGCPVIASLTGVDMVLLVTEPTPSGLHDMARVADLASQFGVPSAACVNKWDLYPEGTAAIDQYCRTRSIDLLGKVRYDPSVTKAQMKGLSVVEYGECPAREDIVALWDALAARLDTLKLAHIQDTQ